MKLEYIPVDASEDGSDGNIWDEVQLMKQNRRLRLYNTLLLVLSGFAVILTLSMFFTRYLEMLSDGACAARLQAPFLDDIEYVSEHLDNGFEHMTKYRGPPTNRLEWEWERLWNHDLISIPIEKLQHMNKSSEDLWLEAPGGFAANLDLFHQLHCLNLVRQYTWKDYYNAHPDLVQKPFDMARAPDDEAIRVHVDHCLETLRLTLMCHGDVTPYLHVKHSSADTLGTADFDMNHKCRNFERIVDAFEKEAVRERYPGVQSRQYETLVD